MTIYVRTLLVVSLSLCSILVTHAAGESSPSAPPADDPQYKNYMNATEAAEQKFDGAVTAAQKVRDEKVKQATDIFVTVASQAANVLQEVRKKTVATAVLQYDLRSKEAAKQGNLDEAIKIRSTKERFLEVAKADDDRIASKIQTLTGADSLAKSDELFNPKQVKQQIIPIANFLEKYTKSFPSTNNLARLGNATASSTDPFYEDPSAVLGGVRWHDIWCLWGRKGWLQATWQKPPSGQYLLVFPRTTNPKNDLWGKARLEINGQPSILIDSMGPQLVLMIDLGKVVSIKSLKFDFDGTGTDNPGFCGIEIHREMKK